MLENTQQDAVLAAQAGVDGILLSNHGGVCTISKGIQVCDIVFRRPAIRLVRILIPILRSQSCLEQAFHSSLPPIEVLHSIRLQRPDVFTKLEGL